MTAPITFFRPALTAMLALSLQVLPAQQKEEQGATPPITVKVDYSAAPECRAFAEKSQALCVGWFPKITRILFGEGHVPRHREVTLVFKPMKGVASASGNRIEISAEWVTKKAPDDYGMVIHELTHVVQDYQGKGLGWLTEGIADYIRDRHFEPGKRNHTIDRARNSYKQGYGIAAAFLMWLEDTKTGDKDLVRKLNQASFDGTLTPERFKELCGADVDTLWAEFTAKRAR